MEEGGFWEKVLFLGIMGRERKGENMGGMMRNGQSKEKLGRTPSELLKVD